MQMQAIIQSVGEKQMNGSNGPWTRYDVTTNEGTYQAKRDVASIAASMVGHPVLIDVESKQNGQYTNHYLNSVLYNPNGFQTPGQQQTQQLQQQAPPLTQTLQQPLGSPQTGFQGSPVVQAAQQAQQAQVGYQDRQEAETRESINRSVAVKSMALMSAGSIDQFWVHVDDVLKFLAHGTRPVGTYSQVAQNIVGQTIQAQPQEQQFQPGPSTDDDIPF